MFYIRADGNSKIGMGHIMRCISVATAVCGKKPVFITADGGCDKLIRDNGFDNIVLNTDYTQMESELPILGGILKDDDIILVDSYQVTQRYFMELRKLCKTACLEDMGNPYPVEVLINYNIYAPNLKDMYISGQNKLIQPKKILLGLKYMPLREDFRSDLEYPLKDKVTDVMLTTGGGDSLYCAGAILKKLTKIPNITFHVVSGPFNKNADRLKSEYGGCPNVLVHEKVRDMKALMKMCDVVITATGSTIYEVSALGVPMICFYFADNQRQGAQELALATDIVNAGCYMEDIEGCVDKIYRALLKCIDDFDYRKTIHGQEKNLIDGKGAYRIARILTNTKQRDFDENGGE